MEQTLVLLKPDAVQRRLIGAIISRFEQKGLQIVGMKMLEALPSVAEAHYAVHKGKSFYISLIEFITDGPVIAMVLEGPDAVATVRRLVGATTEAIPGTIRGDYSLATMYNLIHASDSLETAETEIELWFPNTVEYIQDYSMADRSWVHGN